MLINIAKTVNMKICWTFSAHNIRNRFAGPRSSGLKYSGRHPHMFSEFVYIRRHYCAMYVSPCSTTNFKHMSKHIRRISSTNVHHNVKHFARAVIAAITLRTPGTPTVCRNYPALTKTFSSASVFNGTFKLLVSQENC